VKRETALVGLAGLMGDNGITPRDLAEGSDVALSGVYDILAGRRSPTRVTIDAILAYLSRRLDRKVTYEEAFAPVATVAPEQVA
jgi:predicted transcriptional regulator